MANPTAGAARAAAVILAPELGDGLLAEVEVALAPYEAQQRQDRYLDPVSLGSLIVSIAALTWTVYKDVRARHTSPPSDVIARQVRVILREQDTVMPAGTERVIEIVAAEIIRHNGTPDDKPPHL